jgi:tetratricopeptide (TPR) repeat protein
VFAKYGIKPASGRGELQKRFYEKLPEIAKESFLPKIATFFAVLPSADLLAPEELEAWSYLSKCIATIELSTDKKHIEKLHLTKQNIVLDANLSVVGTLSELKVVNLAFSRFAAKPPLNRFSQCKKLEQLILYGAQDVTDETLKEIKDLPSLTFLHIGMTQGTLEGIDESILEKLEFLYLDNTKLGPSRLSRLGLCKRLKMVSLRSMKLEDSDLTILKQMPTVDAIEIGSATITEHGLEILADLPNIKRVDMKGSPISEEDIRKFQAKRPDCEIILRETSELPIKKMHSQKPSKTEAESTSFYNTGIAKLKNLNFQGAIADFSEAIRLNPKNSKAYCSRAIAKINLSDFDGAKSDCTVAIELDPIFVLAFNSRGSANLRQGEIREAISDFSEGIRIDPSFIDGYFKRGVARYKLEEYSRAIEDFDQVIRQDSENSLAYQYRGYAKDLLKDYHGSISDFNLAILHDKTNANLYNERGWSFLRIGDFSHALRDFEECRKLHPISTHALNNHSFLFSACPDDSFLRPAEALQLAELSESLGPKRAHTLNALSCAYASVGEFEKAIKYQELALQSAEWANDKEIDGGVHAQDRLAKWRAGKQWRFSIEK